MIQILKIISLSLISLVSACDSSQKKSESLPVINIEANMTNMKQVNLSLFANDCYYIPLENLKELELQGIYKNDISDSLIFVSDLKQCLLFDIKGNFISRIGNKGRGPEEYSTVNNLIIGNNRKVYVQTWNDLLEYNPDGSFSREYKNMMVINNDHISSLFPINDTLFLGKIDHATGQERYKAIIFEKDNGYKYYFRNYLSITRQGPIESDYEMDANIYKFGEIVFFQERSNDTLFYLNNQNKLVPAYYFNLGKLKLPFFTGGREDLQDYVSKIRNYIWIENTFQTPNYLLVDCQFNALFPAHRLTPRVITSGITSLLNTSKVLGIFNKKTRGFEFCKPTSTDNPLFTSGLYNDIDAGPRFFPLKQVNDSTMVMWVTTRELKDHVAGDDFKNNVPKYPEKKKQLEELANSLTEFDNPILMFVTFKK